MIEFEKERQIECETFAIINYFKILKFAEMITERNEENDVFCFMNGMDLVRKLVMDCQQGRINIYEDSIDYLFEKLSNHIQCMSNIRTTKTTLTEIAFQDFAFIKGNYEQVWQYYEQWNVNPFGNIFLDWIESLPEEAKKEIKLLKLEKQAVKERK